jgi:hypothetical protein
MAISSYPRTIQNGQPATNGSANSGVGLMLFDSATNQYIAATPSTFAGGGGGGDATAANQTTQISLATLLNSNVANEGNQTIQINNQLAATNGGVLLDTFATQTLTSSFVALASVTCKSVTLINLSTNAKFSYRQAAGGILTLEAGYSVRINVARSQDILIAQTTGEGQTAQIIITA